MDFLPISKCEIRAQTGSYGAQFPSGKVVSGNTVAGKDDGCVVWAIRSRTLPL